LKKFALFSLFIPAISACYNPQNFAFDIPVTNKTRVASIFCNGWDKIGENLVKSTCQIDNLNKTETKDLEIRAYDKQGMIIGSAFIGKATIGEKVRINKAMIMERLETPAQMTLETVEVL